jgi:hypothetical protein
MDEKNAVVIHRLFYALLLVFRGMLGDSVGLLM